MGGGEGGLELVVLLILGVEVEDYLGQLGNLLRHLVVSLFRNRRHCSNIY